MLHKSLFLNPLSDLKIKDVGLRGYEIEFKHYIKVGEVYCSYSNYNCT